MTIKPFNSVTPLSRSLSLDIKPHEWHNKQYPCLSKDGTVQKIPAMSTHIGAADEEARRSVRPRRVRGGRGGTMQSPENQHVSVKHETRRLVDYLRRHRPHQDKERDAREENDRVGFSTRIWVVPWVPGPGCQEAGR